MEECISEEYGGDNGKKKGTSEPAKKIRHKVIMNNGTSQQVVAGRLETLNGGIFTGISERYIRKKNPDLKVLMNLLFFARQK